jgi:rod shape-determining protein MreC
VNFKRYRDWLIVVLSLAVPFWFLRASMKDPKQATGADRVLVQIAAPIQTATAILARGLSHLWSDYVYLVDVKADNSTLVSDNARLRERTRELESLETENRRLRRLLDLKNSVQDDVVTAQVVGKTTNEFFRMMRVTLDRSCRICQCLRPTAWSERRSKSQATRWMCAWSPMQAPVST